MLSKLLLSLLMLKLVAETVSGLNCTNYNSTLPNSRPTLPYPYPTLGLMEDMKIFHSIVP